jgi:GxxExxY protein
VELKAVESIHPVHLAQVITYLKLTGCPAGLLMNFNTVSLRSGLRRLNHPELHQQKAALSRP